MAFALLATALGCVTVETTPLTVDPLEGAPEWVKRGCRSHAAAEASLRGDRPHRKVICGVGSARTIGNPIAAERTAIARARTAIARNIEVTIESLVRIKGDGRRESNDDWHSIIQQFTSTALPACQLDATWQSSDGEFFALVSLAVARVQESLRQTPRLSPGLSQSERDDLVERAGVAFSLDHDSSRGQSGPSMPRPTPSKPQAQPPRRTPESPNSNAF